jgi:hypothetical protein
MSRKRGASKKEEGKKKASGRNGTSGTFEFCPLAYAGTINRPHIILPRRKRCGWVGQKVTATACLWFEGV